LLQIRITVLKTSMKTKGTLKTIKSKQPIMEELDVSIYGIPTLEVCYPFLDEDNSDEVVGCFTIIT